MNSPFKIVLQANNADELEKIPNIRQVLTLCHVINTIRSAQRSLILVSEQPPSPARARDTVFGLISTSAFVYEGMTTAYQVLKKLGTNIPQQLQSKFAWLHSEINSNSDSFYHSVLDPLRNKLAFHFSNVLTSQPFASTVETYPPILGSGSSEANIDYAYTLPDDLLTIYLASLNESTDSPQAKVTRLVEQLAEYNTQLCDILDDAITFLIENHSQLQILSGNQNEAAV